MLSITRFFILHKYNITRNIVKWFERLYFISFSNLWTKNSWLLFIFFLNTLWQFCGFLSVVWFVMVVTVILRNSLQQILANFHKTFYNLINYSVVLKMRILNTLNIKSWYSSYLLLAVWTPLMKTLDWSVDKYTTLKQSIYLHLHMLDILSWHLNTFEYIGSNLKFFKQMWV